MPLATLLGLAGTPGHVAGFGPLDATLARELAALGANHPESRCCLTVTGDGLRLLQDLRRSRLVPPRRLRPGTATAGRPGDAAENVSTVA